MPQRLYPPVAPQSIGEVMDSVVAIFRASFVKSLPFGIAAVIVGKLPSTYALAAGIAPGQGTRSPLWWAVLVASTVALMAIWAALLVRVRAIGQGDAVSARGEFGVALARLPAVLAGAALALLALGASLAPFAIARSMAGSGPAAPMLVVSVYVAVPLCFAIPPLVLEGTPVLAGIRRGFDLMHRRWWRTFGALALAMLLLFVLAVVFFAVGGLLSGGAQPPGAAAEVSVAAAIATVVAIVVDALVPIFGCAVLLAIYGDLTVRSEADRSSRLAAQQPGA